MPGIATIVCDLLTPELADAIAQASRVIFVDAAVDSPETVQMRPLQPAQSAQLMAHAADPRTLLALARDVFGHAPKAWWLTIPIRNTGIGEELSAFARKGMIEAVERVLALAKGQANPKSAGRRPKEGRNPKSE